MSETKRRQQARALIDRLLENKNEPGNAFGPRTNAVIQDMQAFMQSEQNRIDSAHDTGMQHAAH